MTTSDFIRPGSAADSEKRVEATQILVEGLEFYRLVAKSPDESLRLEDNGAGTLLVGKAVPGASEASPVWQIKKILTSGGNISILFPSGDGGYNYVWADRAGYDYL